MATKTVVLVEDDPTISTVLRVGLESRGLTVHSAEDGVAGLALIRKVRPDAALLDIKMPKMNGYQLCAALQSDPALAGIPILVMTGLTAEDGAQPDKVWRDRMGVADFVSKPFDAADVVERTLTMLERRANTQGEELMRKRPGVLIVCDNKATADGVARELASRDLDAVAANDLADALLRLKSRTFDMLIAETQIGSASGLTFLAEANKLLPGMLRAVLETTPIAISAHALVNEVSPAAIFSGSIDADRVARLLGERRSKLTLVTASAMENVVEERNAFERRMEGEMERVNTIMLVSSSLTTLIEDPDLVLPVLPEVAVQVRRLMASEDSSFEAIADLVGTEQGMAARILQVANSPIYAGLERIRNIQQAVTRLGLRETRNILQAVIAQNLFRTDARRFQDMMRQLWLHSLATAYSNEMIAQKLNIPDSDDYFMMGLLHDIGKLVVFHLILEGHRQGLWDESATHEDVVRKVLIMRHNDLGARLSEKWEYPQAFREVVRLHDDAINIERRSEPVIVTYFSNLLTRKIGLSLVPYDGDPLSSKALADALNMTNETRENFEISLRVITEKIKQSCFAR